MRIHKLKGRAVSEAGNSVQSFEIGSFFFRLFSLFLTVCLLHIPRAAEAQVNVYTAHNDSARTGQNINETILTPQNVNANQFGKLFSFNIGPTHAQPLYVSNVTIPGKGVHNVVYVGAVAGLMYAFDADTNGGISSTALWRTSLLATVAGSQPTVYSILGTPVIDPTTKTIYVICQAQEGSAPVFRLHALDMTTGAEKLGGPVKIQGSVSGTGSGSTGGVLAFDPSLQYQRPALLLQNGVIYAGFGSQDDIGTWHGWVMSFSAATLQQIAIWNTTANGGGGGLWMGGFGLAGDVYDPVNKPYGRLFFSTGNGSYTAAKPYQNNQSYAMSVVSLDLTGGQLTVQDEFTPHDWQLREGQDGDLGSGGVMVLPQQRLASGAILNPLVHMGKSGTMYLIDRNNLTGFNATADQIVQEVQTPESGAQNWGAGVWGGPAYWNNNIFYGGTNHELASNGSANGPANSFTAYSFINGVISNTPTSESAEQFPYPGPTPSVSANGNTNGIAWVLETGAYVSKGNEILLAYDATNLANLLYRSDTNLARDNPGGAVTFVTPTIANGKVYVGSVNGLVVYGLLASTPTAAAPVINPASASFTGTQSVSITDSTPAAQIYYTTDGSTPTVGSTLYTGPFTLSTSTKVTALATATGYLQSTATAATFTATSHAATPLFSLAAGTYLGTQTLTISDSSSGSAIYFTLDGSTPSTSSGIYTQPLTITVGETVQAIATAPGLLPSAMVSATYDIDPVYTIDFSQGFSQAQGPIQFNGSTDLDDFRLQLTNGGLKEAGSAFYATPVNIQSFTTDFTFQISNPVADGFTFTIQNVGPGAVGLYGGGLGYQNIAKSVAIKFDIYSNSTEGSNSTGMYVNGAIPTMPAVSLVNSGINLHSGNYTNAHLTYDGVNLTLTLSDPLTLATWSQSFAVNIPAIVGGPTAFVGFTGGSGGLSSSQKLTYWTYMAGPPQLPNYPAGFDGVGFSMNSAVFSGSALQLTNGGAKETTSAYFSTPVDIQSFTTDFDFQLTRATGDGFTFVIRKGNGPSVGGTGGGLGFATIPSSVAIKFDIYSNAGEGSDSTGVYLNGAMPTLPAVDLTSSGLKLNSGDVIHAHITYDGTTLIWTLTDKTSTAHPTSTQQALVNIPQAISNNLGYVGFTAASGGATAVQNILNWSLTNP